VRSPIGVRVLDHARAPLNRNAYALILNSGLVAITGFAYWALAARLFIPADLGIGAALISLVTFLSGLTQLNLRPGLSRFVPVAGRQASRLVASAYMASVAAGLVVGFVFLVGLPIWNRDDRFGNLSWDSGLAAPFLAAIVLWSVFALQDGVLIGLGRAVWVPAENGIFSVAKLLFLPVLVLAGWAAAPAILVSWIGPMLLAILAVNVMLFARLLPMQARAAPVAATEVRPRRLLPFLAGDYFASLFNLVYVTLPPVLVVAFVGAEAGGYFYVVWVIATAMQLVPRQLTTSLIVEAARSPTELPAHVRSTIWQVGRIVLPMCLGIAIFGRLILSAFDDRYAEAGTLPLALLALAVIPYAINTLAIGISRVRAAAGQIIGIEVGLAVLIMGLSFLLAGRWGSTGVAAAWLAGQLAIALPAFFLRIRPLLQQAGQNADQDRRS
jgi:O-antigen/teichoic acid export membrane protein